MSNKMNLRQKLFEIQKEVKFFVKDKDSFNYSYASGTAVLSKVRSKMDELGVMLETHLEFNQEITCDMFKKNAWDNKKREMVEKRVVDTKVSQNCYMVWVDVDSGEERKIPWALMGQQDDDVSKAWGSGLTYSERYFILKYFKVPTDKDDPDNKENHKSYQDEKPADLYDTYTIKSGKMAGKLIKEIDDKGWLEYVATKGNNQMKPMAIRRLNELKGKS